MKIAIIRQECSFQRGGAERYCANLCRELANRGHDVHVLAKHLGPDIHPTLKQIPIQINRSTSAARTLSFHHNCQKALKRLHVDRVYALARSYPADAVRISDPLHLAWMRLRYRSRWRYLIERINPRHLAILRLEKSIFQPKNTRAVITNSDLVRRQIHELYKFPLERIHVVYNGVDSELFSPLASAASSRRSVRMLFVAMDFKRKGLHHVLAGMARLKKMAVDCSLKVVGKGREKAYRKMTLEMGITDRVTFHGPTPQVVDFYRSEDILVFPTAYDPFANVCLEALACGMPVITTTTNGASELIIERRNGYVLNGVESIPDQIVKVIEAYGRLSPTERRRMSEDARSTAAKFTIVKNVDDTLKILESI